VSARTAVAVTDFEDEITTEYCSACAGTGETFEVGRPCPACAGRGEFSADENDWFERWVDRQVDRMEDFEL
jgi:DnaJ-class molecular chaperone